MSTAATAHRNQAALVGARQPTHSPRVGERFAGQARNQPKVIDFESAQCYRLYSVLRIFRKGLSFFSHKISVVKRIFDLLLALLASLVLIWPMLLVAIAVRLTSKGPALYWSDRIGRNNVIFKMPKFRSMRIDTPAVATHLLEKPEAWLTPIGSLIRKTSLDELPQLWCILKGDMNFVGPRPALFNQHDLITLRTEQGVHALVPGLTGWAQINGRDKLSSAEKVHFDAQYLQTQSFCLDFQILLRTFVQTLNARGVKH